jgi:serine/threonine protein phosphatase PrpC
MLGDGLISIIKMDGTILSLAEDKTDSFSNITNSLSKNMTNKEWRFLRLQENLCRAVLLCTDGVSDDLVNTEGFVSGFVSYAVDLSCVSASRYTRELLNNWPTPKHSDDKTIACLFRKEAGDE